MGGKVFYTSDLHIGHTFVAGLRGFDTVEEHDAWLAEKWDQTVNPQGDRGDIVYILGDISAGGNAAQANALSWFMQRRGEKILIPGNHDGCHPMNRDAEKWDKKYQGVFRYITPFMRKKIFGHNVLLSHFPYEGEGEREGEERYPQYRLPSMGLPVLHGHTHSKNRVSHTTIPIWDGKDGLTNALQIHVGVDAWDGNPIPVELIGEILNAGTS